MSLHIIYNINICVLYPVSLCLKIIHICPLKEVTKSPPHICTNFCAELEAGIQAKSWSATASEFQLLI